MSRSWSQYTLSGRITDSANTPVSYATVTLLKDTSVLQTTASDSSGRYSFSGIDSGSYRLLCSYLGSRPPYRNFSLSHDTTINLSVPVPGANMLNGVVVTAEKPLIESKVDRIVFNVENSILSKGLNAIDVLRETPRLEVNGNDAIKMLGKGSLQVMINGRILNLSDEDLKNRLKYLRSDDIASVEVISIPPAKYSAEGNSGLINIVLKKNPDLGWKGSVNAEFIQRIYSSYSQSANLNFQSSRIEASLGVSNNHSDNVNESAIFYDFFSAGNGLHTTGRTNFISNARSLNGIFKYKIARGTETGVTIDYSNRPGHNTDRDQNRYTSGAGNVITDSTVASVSRYQDRSEATALSAYLDCNLDSAGRKVSVTYNYSLNSNSSSKLISSAITVPDTDDKNTTFQNNGDNAYRIHSVTVDFDLPYRFAKLQSGGSFTLLDNRSGLKLFNEDSGEIMLDSSGSNNFDYSEKTGAAYLSAQKDIGKKWSGQAGLRFEYTSVRGFSPTLHLENRTNYGKLFPSVFVLYRWSDLVSLSLAYSKRIERPRFNDLNPFRYYSGVYSYLSGNAYLLPSFSHNLELSFFYHNNLTVILSGSRSLENIGYISLFSHGVNSLSPENCYNQNRLGLDISYTYRPYKWWNIYSSGNVNYNRNRSYVEALQIPDVEGFGSSVGSRSTFTLNRKKTTFLSLRYMQFFPSQNGLDRTRSFGYTSANFRFNALKNTLTFLISALDIFKQNHTVTQMKYLTYTSEQRFDPKGQNLLVSVTYNFGNSRVSNVNRESKNTEKQRAF